VVRKDIPQLPENKWPLGRQIQVVHSHKTSQPQLERCQLLVVWGAVVRRILEQETRTLIPVCAQLGALGSGFSFIAASTIIPRESRDPCRPFRADNGQSGTYPQIDLTDFEGLPTVDMCIT
jgi:hypothetical protein